MLGRRYGLPSRSSAARPAARRGKEHAPSDKAAARLHALVHAASRRSSASVADAGPALKARRPATMGASAVICASTEEKAPIPRTVYRDGEIARAQYIDWCNLNSPARTSSSRIISSSMVSRTARGEIARSTPAARTRSDSSNSIKASERFIAAQRICVTVRSRPRG